MTLWMPVMGSETVTPPRRDARGGRRDRSNLTAKIAEIAERDGILSVFSAFFAVMSIAPRRFSWPQVLVAAPSPCVSAASRLGIGSAAFARRKVTKGLAFSLARCGNRERSLIVGPASGDGPGGEEVPAAGDMMTITARGVGMTQRRMREPPGQPRDSCCQIQWFPHSGTS